MFQANSIPPFILHLKKTKSMIDFEKPHSNECAGNSNKCNRPSKGFKSWGLYYGNTTEHFISNLTYLAVKQIICQFCSTTKKMKKTLFAYHAFVYKFSVC